MSASCRASRNSWAFLIAGALVCGRALEVGDLLVLGHPVVAAPEDRQRPDRPDVLLPERDGDAAADEVAAGLGPAGAEAVADADGPRAAGWGGGDGLARRLLGGHPEGGDDRRLLRLPDDGHGRVDPVGRGRGRQGAARGRRRGRSTSRSRPAAGSAPSRRAHPRARPRGLRGPSRRPVPPKSRRCRSAGARARAARATPSGRGRPRRRRSRRRSRWRCRQAEACVAATPRYAGGEAGTIPGGSPRSAASMPQGSAWARPTPTFCCV